MSNVVFLLLVVASLALAEALYHFVRWLGEHRRDELRHRLRSIGEPEAGLQLLRRRRLARWRILDEALSPLRPMQRLAGLIEQTDLEWTVARLLVYCVLYGALGAMLGALLWRSALLAALVGAGAALVPIASLAMARRRRSTRISEQLPDALEMVARSIRAGHAVPESFKLVAQEAPAPIAVEFGKAFEQQNLGIAFEEAVVQMVARVPGNTDLAIFAVSVVIQRETGGNLVENLEKIAETVRERERFQGKLRSLTAESRVSAWILGSLPFAIALVLFAINRSYVMELTVGLGRTLLVAGLLSWLSGIAWLWSLSRVEY
jgi:tight adherence protein B